MSNLTKRNPDSSVNTTIDAYRSGCADNCKVKDVVCITCSASAPRTGSTVTVAASSASGSC